MAADVQGNDLSAVQVPITGQVYLGKSDTPDPTITGATVTLDADFEPLGLLKVDGGPEWTRNQDGDDTEFWQDGYTLPGTNTWYELKVNCAEDNPVVQEATLGVEPVSGVYKVDASLAPVVRKAYVVEVMKSGKIRRRLGKNVVVSAVAEDRSTRGDVKGVELTLRFNRAVDGGHFDQHTHTPTP